MRKCVSEFVNALVIIHEVSPWCVVGSADNHRRRITEETISLNVGMLKKMRKCVNVLVSFRNANETSPWGDGNLADRGVK